MVLKNLYCLALAAFLMHHSFVYGQSIAKTITFSDTVKDYGPVITKAIYDAAKTGKTRVQIKYGIYPLLTPVVINIQTGKPNIVVIGVKNSKGKLPVFTDTVSSRPPHHFFQFWGNVKNPAMTVSLSNIEIIGNNVPYSPTHPFFGRANLTYYHALSGINIYTMKVENVTIRNFYGRGIFIANYFNNRYDRRNRVESPIVRNCKILNVWGHSKKDDSGDAIEFFSANKPLVENCLILNDLKQTKYMGRGGIVLEHNTEKGVVRNNKIGGYSRNFHAECDWGGHLIENNHFSQSSIAVTLSEDCSQPDSLKDEFSPIVIRNNTMVYQQELLTYKIPRSAFSFISIYKPSPMLEGLQILNNKMTILPGNSSTPLAAARTNTEQSRKRYIDIKTQDKVTIKGNSYN